MTDDRSSVVKFNAAKRGGECRLTALATALRDQRGNKIEWLARKVCGLCLPPEEFTLTIGVKIERGYRFEVSPHLLPPANRERLLAEHPVETQLAALTRAEQTRWNVTAYELLVEWRCESPTWYPDEVRGVWNIAIPVAWVAAVLENPGQDEAAFRSRIRWLMTELMLARYSIDSYREER